MQTVIRESEEEIGVMYDIYFSIEKCPAEPVIGEPGKCSDLK